MRLRKVLVVGAGFAGAVCARQLADAGHQVRIVDQRGHLGGNAQDRTDSHGVLIHPYGPHIFHTNSARIVEYLSRFTDWRPYEHRVLAKVQGQLLPIPINRTTVNRLYGLELDEPGIAAHFERVRTQRAPILSSEDVVLNSVGEDLCEKFFRNYTKKQWGIDLRELSPGVAARIPTRTSDDDRYFTDSHQAMPAQGYTKMFERMLDHSLIQVELKTAWRPEQNSQEYAHIVYTGPIDAFFGLCHGALEYRSLRFEHEHLPSVQQFQPVGTVNYPNEQDYTRITEFKHLTAQSHTGTSIVREYPMAQGEPYYPIPRPANEARFQRYRSMGEALANVSFVGRLAQYRYYNMDQVVGAALTEAERIIERMRR